MILVWLFVAYGMTSIIVWGSIFQPMRDSFQKWSEKGLLKHFWYFFYKLTSCMLCTGTWVGFFLGAFFASPLPYFFNIHPLLPNWFFDGMFAAGGIWIIHSFVEVLERLAKD